MSVIGAPFFFLFFTPSRLLVLYYWKRKRRRVASGFVCAWRMWRKKKKNVNYNYLQSTFILQCVLLILIHFHSRLFYYTWDVSWWKCIKKNYGYRYLYIPNLWDPIRFYLTDTWSHYCRWRKLNILD